MHSQKLHSSGEQGHGVHMLVAVPPVVPPPPPGFIGNQGAIGAGTGGTGTSAHDIESGEAWPPLPPPPPPIPAGARRCSSELVHHTVTPGEGGSFSIRGGAGQSHPLLPHEAREPRRGGRDHSFETGSFASRSGETGYSQAPLHMATRETSHGTGECSSFGVQGSTGHPPQSGRSLNGFQAQMLPGTGQEPARDALQDRKYHASQAPQDNLAEQSLGPYAPEAHFDLFGGSCHGGRPLTHSNTQAKQAMPGLGIAHAALSGQRLPTQAGLAAGSSPIPGLTPPNLFAGGSTPLSFSNSFGQSFGHIHSGAGMTAVHGQPAGPPPRWR